MTCALEKDLIGDVVFFFCVPDPNESRAAVISLLVPFVRLIKMKSTIYESIQYIHYIRGRTRKPPNIGQ